MHSIYLFFIFFSCFMHLMRCCIIYCAHKNQQIVSAAIVLSCNNSLPPTTKCKIVAQIVMFGVGLMSIVSIYTLNCCNFLYLSLTLGNKSSAFSCWRCRRPRLPSILYDLCSNQIFTIFITRNMSGN